MASQDEQKLPLASSTAMVIGLNKSWHRLADLFVRPAIDAQGSHLKVSSTVPNVSFNQWEASATLKMGWRF